MVTKPTRARVWVPSPQPTLVADAGTRRGQIRRVARGQFLFDLQEQRVMHVVAEQQHDVVAGADAAGADQLERHVGRLISLECPSATGAQRGGIRLERTDYVPGCRRRHMCEIGFPIVKPKPSACADGELAEIPIRRDAPGHVENGVEQWLVPFARHQMTGQRRERHRGERAEMSSIRRDQRAHGCFASSA